MKVTVAVPPAGTVACAVELSILSPPPAASVTACSTHTVAAEAPSLLSVVVTEICLFVTEVVTKLSLT